MIVLRFGISVIAVAIWIAGMVNATNRGNSDKRFISIFVSTISILIYIALIVSLLYVIWM